MRKFKKGDKVVITDSSIHAGQQPRNPNKTKTSGEIIEIRPTSFCYSVRFNNGYQNSYDDIDLELYISEPNYEIF